MLFIKTYQSKNSNLSYAYDTSGRVETVTEVNTNAVIRNFAAGYDNRGNVKNNG